MIDITNLTLEFKNKMILHNISLSVSESNIVGLVAPNGTGKTTFLKAIAGLASKKGSILLNDNDIKNRRVYFKQLFFIESTENIYSNLTVKDHLDYIKSTWKSSIDVTEVIVSLEMEAYKDKPIKKLSLGMKQHVLIGMYMVSDAPILLLDEPMNGLDPTSVDMVNQLFLILKKRGKTIIFSSHNLSNVTKLCDEILFMHDQKLISTKADRHNNVQALYDTFYKKGVQ